jgi:type IV secretion system protein VirB6
MACQGLPASSFLGGVLDFVDCQAETIGSSGYQALAAPGSSLSLVLAGLLTLFVAFFGYRMLFGETPSVRDGVLALVKIGIVLALATGWPAYRTLIYDVALKGPAELAGEIGGPSALPGAGGGLVARLGNADRLLLVFSELGPGAAAVPAPSANTAGETPQPPSTYTELFLAGARILFLTGAIAALALVRLIAGLLLALGPFFIAFLLFEGTRGLFEGWLRVLGGAALGALGAGVALGVELALIEPWLANLIAARAAGYATPGAPVELFVVALVFTLALAAMLAAAARVAYGFRLPSAWRALPIELGQALRGGSLRVSAQTQDPLASADRSRAVTIADAVAATQRRETPALSAALPPDPGAVPSAHRIPGQSVARDLPPAAPIPLGQSFPRRTRGRQSASVGRRDRRP